jgi:hypothetical protein
MKKDPSSSTGLADPDRGSDRWLLLRSNGSKRCGCTNQTTTPHRQRQTTTTTTTTITKTTTTSVGRNGGWLKPCTDINASA